MTENNYLIRDYEEKVNGRVLCKQHGLLRCSECAYIDDLFKQNKRYREALEFYADKNNHHRETDYGTDSGLADSEVMKDGGKLARQAMEDDNE